MLCLTDVVEQSTKFRPSGTDYDLWHKFCGLGSETWKWCEQVELQVVLAHPSGSSMISLMS